MGQGKGSCSYYADFNFDGSNLTVTGKSNGTDGALDILISRISKDEFFAGVKAETKAKGLNYKTLPKADREAFEKTCNDIGGASCDTLLH